MNNLESAYSLKFRPDIQGLRALAILLVVFCHAGFPGFTGGFIGVDIFFVLSGYLITGLLIKEAHSTSKIQFLRFYSRRFKRLLPALLTVVLTTSVIAYFVLAPFEQIEQAQTAFSVSFWLSNFYFSFSDLNYFAPAVDSNLFLHTWSLAVEEQFYLVWPLLLFVLLLKVQHDNEQGKNKNLLHGLIGLFLLSLCLEIYWLYKAPILAFYLMPSRAWQFALGGIAFFIASNKSLWPDHPKLEENLNLAGLIGIGLIISALFIINDESLYPGFNALLPSLGTGLLLISGIASKSAFYTQVLSWKWMQKIGNLSYSWYLWHWPVLVLGNIVYPQTTFSLQLSLILLSLILAQITYILIETPLRNLKIFTLKPALTVSVSVIAMLTALSFANVWKNTSEKQLFTPKQLDYSQFRNSMPVIYGNGCDDWYTSSRILPCSFGDPNATHTAILIGDSVGAQWFSALSNSFVESGWQFVIFTKSSCPIVDVPIFYDRIGMVYEICSEWRNGVLSLVQEMAPDIVFIGSANSYNYSQAEWQSGTERILAKLTPSIENILIIPGTYQLPFNAISCLEQKEWQPKLIADLSSCSIRVEPEANNIVISALSTATELFPNAHIMDLNSLACPNNTCSAINNGIVVYRDDQHLADSFVSAQSSLVFEKIKDITQIEF